MTGLAVFAVMVFGYGLVARPLARWSLSAPMVFTGLGALMGMADPGLGTQYLEWIGPVAEVALAILLFHDAAQASPQEFRRDGAPVVRLLLIGLPLTVLLGYLLADWMFPELGWAFLLLLAAALAPTDAGLGAATVLNPVVPLRVRRVLNMESGLNDGLATPVVLFAIATLAGQEGLMPRESLASALVEIAIGVAFGVVVGAGGGFLLSLSRRHHASDATAQELAVLSLPVIAYLGAGMVHGNGFIAAFVSGSALAGAARWLARDPMALEFTEAVAEPLGFLVWTVFGLAAVPFLWQEAGWRELGYALASLSVIRMVPVALSLVGTGMARPAVAFIGWFGPRGLASVIFSLLALEALEENEDLRVVLTTISLTVLLSVIAHGVSANPLASRYGRWAAAQARDEPAVVADEPAVTEDESEPKPIGWRRMVADVSPRAEDPDAGD